MYNLSESIQQFWLQQLELYGNSLILPLKNVSAPVQKNSFLVTGGNAGSSIMIVIDSLIETGPAIAFSRSSGQLLLKILKAIELTDKDVFFVTFDKSDIDSNSDLIYKEMSELLENSNTKNILCFGLPAAGLLGLQGEMEKLRSKTHEYKTKSVMITHHPAVLTINKDLKYETWNDVQQFQKIYQ